MRQIAIVFICVFLIIGCQNNKKEDIVDLVTIGNKQYNNQIISFSQDGELDYKKSHFYKIKNNCVEYHSFFDTLNAKIGVDRFIVFKTSKSLTSNFSNINKIKLEKFFFKEPKKLCFDKKIPENGIIEDIVFLKTDSIIDGEQGVRILKSQMYFSSNKSISQ